MLQRLGLALLVVALFGCSESGDSGSNSKSADQQRSKPIEDLVDLPEDAAGTPPRPLTTEEQYVIQAANDRLVSACMAKAGFQWKVVTSRNQPAEPNPYPTKDELARSGYSADFAAMLLSDRDMNKRVREDPINSVPPADRPAYLRAYSGSKKVSVTTGDGSSTFPVDGCAAEASKQLYGSVENFYWLDQIVEVGTPSQLSNAMMDLSDYAAAVRTWQACMRSKGVTWMDGKGAHPDWDTGYEVLLHKAVMTDTPPTQAMEESIASDDSDCATDAGLFGVREKHIEEVKAKLWEGTSFLEADKWKLQQAALLRAKKVS